MTYAIIHLVLFALVLISSLVGNELPDYMSSGLTEAFSTTNILIAFGIIGICWRLDNYRKGRAANERT